LVLAVSVVLLARSESHAISGAGGAYVWTDASLLWGFGTVALLLMAVVTPLEMVGRIVLIGLLPLESIAMFVTPELSTLRGGAVDLSVVSFLQQNTGLDRVYTLGPLQPNYGSYFDINSLNVNDLPVPKTFRRLVLTQLDPNANPLVFTGSRSVHPGGLTPAQALASYLPAYERFGVNYILVSSKSPDLPANLRLWLVYHDPVADVYAVPYTRPFYSGAAGTCLFGSATYSRVLVNCRTPAVVTRDELNMPGWAARVDGRPVPVRSDADGLQTVAVPAGQSTVGFSFEPPHTNVAFVVAVIGLALCAASAVAAPIRTRLAGRRRQSGS
jgi:hypothetical protein